MIIEKIEDLELPDLDANSPNLADSAERATEQFDLCDLVAFNPKDDPDCLLGKRFLGRTGSMLIVGQSGIGKSSFILQMAVTFAIGKPFFGIQPNGKLRVLIIQAENDAGDCAEAFQGVLAGLGYNRADLPFLKDLQTRLEIHRDTLHTGIQFVAALDALLKKSPRDLIIADPLLSFLGDDVSDQKAISTFCRNLLNPVLHRHKCALIFAHHTGKPVARDHKSLQTDAAYAGIGSSELVNWARAIMVLQRQANSDERQIYKLTIAKRGFRAGIVDDSGRPINSIFIQHSDRGIAWEPADYEPPERGERNRFKEKYDTAEMLALYDERLSKTENWNAIAKAIGCSPRTVERRLQHHGF